ncbi:MAG: ribosome maturation factor RimP [Gammaproteobacteria bacterium]|nr:ribosome maturation factor RimP [Gammaproteobacteria bacterium]
MDRKALIEWLEPEVAAQGCELLDLEWQCGRNAILRLYIDTPEGIGLDDCQRVSRAVEAVLDVEDPLPAGYRLEVSSPGPERPLRTPEHFSAAMSEELRLQVDVDGAVRKLRGRLVAMKEGALQLENEDGAIEIELDNVLAARQVAHENEL